MEVHLAGSEHVKWTQVRVPSFSLPPAPAPAPAPPLPRDGHGDDGHPHPHHRHGFLPTLSSDLAGTSSFGAPSFRHIIWRICKSSPSSVDLFELHDNEAQVAGLHLCFEEALSPFVSVYPEQVHSGNEEERLCVCAVTISGTIYVLQIRTFYKYRNMSSITRSDMVQFSLGGDLARLDQVTAFAALGGCICLGGNSGSIICYHSARVSGSCQDYSFELKDTEPLLGRLWGLVARAKNAGPVRSLNIQKHEEKLLLFVLHEDGIFRLWDLCDHSRQLSVNLQKDLTNCFPKMMWIQEQGFQNEFRKLAFHFDNKETSKQGILQIYELQFPLMDTAASLTFLFQLLSIEGTVLDVKFLADSFWKLEEAYGCFNLSHHSLDREELLENCILLEAELEEQLFQKSTDNWENLILFQQSTLPGTKHEFQVSVSEFFISRILQSRFFQRVVLFEVLQKFRRISETDFSILSRDGLCKEILAVVEADKAGNDKLDHLMAWKAFCTDYFTLWKLKNKPIALLVDGYTGTLGIIRHQSLSIRRSLSEFEKYNANVGFGSDSSKAKEFWGLLFKCMSSISKQLGRLPLSTFGQALLENKNASLSHICAVFLHLLDGGYDYSILTEAVHYGVDTGRKKRQEYQRDHRKFELQIIFDLRELRDSVGGWETALENMETYINQLMQDTRVSILQISSKALEFGIMSKQLVLESIGQLSWTYFGAARDILLLLSYILSIQGQVGMTASNVSKVQLKLIVPLKKILLLSLLVHWLSVTSAEIAPPEDFSLHLSSLQLDSRASEKPSSKHIGAIETTLAEILMSAFSASKLRGLFLKSKGLISSDELVLATKAFIGWIMWGEIPELNSVSTRAISLAPKFLEHGQFSHLQSFLHIVDNICNETETHNQDWKDEWCARLHLMGCSLLGQAHTTDRAANEKRVEEAIRCFFRVASAVGQCGEDIDSFLAKTGMGSSFPRNGSTASWAYQYFEWVMQIFEQNSVSGGVCQFAYAALQEVDKIEGNFFLDSREASCAIHTIKGRLWSNIFKFSLEQKNFIESYCAIISNPDQESKYICLRRFLIVLCEQKAFEVLCGSEVPYAGMLERVEQELVLKATYSDVTTNPNPFKLLYAFHMQRNNWRRAALYMYLYSVRVKETGLVETRLSSAFSLQEQLNSLAAAINALHLVDPTSAWLDLESDICGSLSCRPSKRIRIYANNEAAHTVQRSVDLEELQKEYTLTSAQLLLVENGVLLGGEVSPSSVLTMLVQSDLYEMAFTVLLHFWKNSAFKCELERIFRIMAERWCLCQQDNRGTREIDRKLLLLPPPETKCATDNVDSSAEFTVKEAVGSNVPNALQGYLIKYAKLHSRLPVIVAETMLNIDRLIELPVWLVDMLKGGRQAAGEGMSLSSADPGALLRIYLDYGRISEAAILFVEFVKAWTNLPPSHVVKRKRMCSVWFPYTLVDRLKAALLEVKTNDQFVNLHKLLDNTLQRHFNQVETDSVDVKSLVQH